MSKRMSKKMSKRILLWLLALAMLVALVGCAETDITTTETVDEAETTADEAETTAPDTEEPELMTLSVELFDRANTPDAEGTLEDNRWTRWIQEEMLKQGVEVSFFPVPRGEETEKINVLMASDSAPDIIMTYDRFLFAKFAMEGGLHDLTEPLDQHGANIKSMFEPEGILEYGQIDGKQYGIVARRSNPNHLVSFIRTDWVEALGMDMPTNRDELVEVLKAFKEQDPGGIGSDNVIPWGSFVGPGSTGFENRHPFRLYNVMYSFFEHSEELMYTTPSPLREGFRDFMEWLNLLYSEGLIDREFGTITGEIINQQINSGRVGFFIEGWWVPGGSGGNDYRALLENVPEAELEAIPVFQNADGSHYHTQYPRTGIYLMSPKTAEYPEAVIKYLDWMAQEDVAYTMSFGIEGEHYDLIDDVPVAKDLDYNTRTMNYIMGDLRLLFNGPLPLPAAVEEELLRIGGGELGEFVVNSSRVAGTDPVPEILFNKAIEAESRYLPELTKTYEEFWIKLIMADDFDSVWDEFQNEIKSRGIEEIQAEYESYYDQFVR